MSRRGWLLFTAMCVIWGVPYLLIRVAVGELTPSTVVFLRTAIAVVVLVPAVRWTHLAALRGRWRVLVVYTVIEVTVPWWLLTNAERHISSSLAGLLVAAVPLFGIALNRLAGARDPVDGRRITGLLLGIAGVAALVGLQIGHVDVVAVCSVLLTAVGYATGPIILSRRLSDAPGSAVVAVSLALTAAVYAPSAVTSWPGHVSVRVIAAVVALGVVCTAAAFLVFFALIAEVGPTRATVITYVNPAVALALGVVALGEHVTLAMAIGFPLVIAGSVLATRRPQTEPAPVPPAGAPALVEEPG